MKYKCKICNSDLYQIEKRKDINYSSDYMHFECINPSCLIDYNSSYQLKINLDNTIYAEEINVLNDFIINFYDSNECVIGAEFKDSENKSYFRIINLPVVIEFTTVDKLSEKIEIYKLID